MLIIPNFFAINYNAALSNLFFVSRNPSLLQLVSSMSSSKVVAEYAKSARSSCKTCAKSIAANDLRLGLVSRDKRGFDMTKWHHLNCFPLDSESIASSEAIQGFSLLKSSDQETVMKLVDGSARSTEKVAVGDEGVVKGSKEMTSKRLRVNKVIHKTDESENDDLEDQNSKKTKLFTPTTGAELDISFSISEIKDKYRLFTPTTGAELDISFSISEIKDKYRLFTPTTGAELDISFSISEIKDKYRDATLLPKWKAFRTVIFLERDEGLDDSTKIAAFDFDGCLVNTSVKRVGSDAWSLKYSSIPEKLQSLYKKGYKLVIFTNESNIDRWKNKRQVAVDSKIGRINNFIKLVEVPIQVFIACGTGKSEGQTEEPFRKPKPGMWHLMEQHFNSGISIDMDLSFYVGDAAGRHNDHSDADIAFAQAIGLKFYVPEEYFSV